MPRMLVAALAALVAGMVALTLAVPSTGAGAAAGATGGASWSADVMAVAGPDQRPDAPADDGTGGSAEEQEDENPQPAVPDQQIIPEPNSGQAPTDAGDRGGALQILVFVAIVAGVGGIGLLALRDMRRSRARSGAAR